ncbi:MAG: site-specific integrase [Haloarculaceae archaeon]
MSENPESEDSTSARQAVAASLGRTLDPLVEFEEQLETTFVQLDTDPLALAKAEVVETRDLTDRTREHYSHVFNQWRDHMRRQGRYVACPNEEHVRAFIEYERETKGNADETVIAKLTLLNVAYEYWQDDPAFPHPQDYNPFRLMKKKADFSEEQPKKLPRISIEELRTTLDDVTNVRDLAILALQLKLGLRATELCNLRASDIHIENPEITHHYDDLGGCDRLVDKQNVVYIPHDREGNKSPRPRLLPLDDELCRILSQYLLLRPTNGTPEVFLSKTRHLPLNKQAVNTVWKDTFHPEYEETDEHRAVTSHFGRHWFTTYWRVEANMNRELVKYLRGDRAGSTDPEDRASINEYIHTYYADIESAYREQIFKLGI